MSLEGSRICIAGAGPAGSLLAILLRRRGFEVVLYERRPDPRGRSFDSGRSINLAMAERGIHALRRAGVFERLRETLIPMRGRLIHDLSGATSLQPYGSRPEEVIHSISRHLLNATLIDIAVREYGARVEFESEVIDCDPRERRLQLEGHGGRRSVGYEVLIAADGAASAVRKALESRGLIDASIEPLDHSYKELTIPADATGHHRLLREALHIWPRGDFMLIALPNPDGTFTATLFLDRQRFADLADPAAVDAFLTSQFPDAAALMPDRLAEFASHPVGHLATVYSRPWHAGSTLLLGDSAHGVVPFHGQGMNCCFEDCVAFDELLPAARNWTTLFEQFTRQRKPNTDAIAQMAIENYLEMREHVADARFQLQKQLSLELERRHPQRFIPRYTMVSFRHDIGYAEAQRRGRVQQEILDELTLGPRTLAEVDFERAARLIETKLPPMPDPPDQPRSSVR